MSLGDDGPLFSFFASVLFFLSLVYSAAVSVRWGLYRTGFFKTRRLPCRVVSIGNMTVGGTGKTPLAIYVARHARRLGYKVSVITRGYKGENEQAGAIVSDGHTVLLGPPQAGDEAYLMACKLKGVPILVGKNRFASGARAIKEFAADVLVLDDGFQHVQLDRDVNLLLLDAHRPLGNGYLLPRGILREPVRHVTRADAFVATRCTPGKKACLGPTLERFEKGRPTFFCTHVPDFLTGDEEGACDLPLSRPEVFDVNLVCGRKVLAFSGIGNNEGFRSTVESLGCDVSDFLTFSDHHAYSENDVERIQQAADDSGVDYILTTEKDYVRIAHIRPWPIRLLAVSIHLVFTDGGRAFDDYLVKKLLLS